MTEPRTTRIPAPLYAAAGAGELAYEQLRKLPTVVTELRGKAVTATVELSEKAAATLREAPTTATALREKAVPAAAALREKAASGDLDLDRIRSEAVRNVRSLVFRNTAAVLAGAQVAQERAVAAYTALVARGERVVGSGVLQAADTVNADMTATETAEAPAPARTEPEPTPVAVAEAVAEAVETKPAKTARPRARATKPADTPSAKLPKAAKRTRRVAE